MADFFAPGFDQQIEQQNIDRQRQYAQALRKQTMPEGRMVGRTYVAPSWTQGLAQMLNAYQGRESENMADEKQKALAQAISGRQASEWGKIAPLLTGTQASEGMPANEMDSGSDMGAVKAQAPNLQGAYAAAMQSQDPALKQFGLSGMAQLPQLEAQKQERIDNRAWRQQESEAARAARAEELRLRMEDGRASQAERLAAQKELREMQIQAAKDTQRMIAASRPAAQPQIIQTENGPMQLIGGKAVPIVGPDGKQVMGKDGAKTPQGQKVQDAKDALSTITLAETLIDKATGSGIGNVVDATAGFFGKSTEGAKGAAQLKALEGDLVSKMPKMSGPQSDKDVILYRQMAGTIGDPTIPRETKKAALNTIREIQNRYAGVAPEGSWDEGQPSAMPPGFKVIR